MKRLSIILCILIAWSSVAAPVDTAVIRKTALHFYQNHFPGAKMTLGDVTISHTALTLQGQPLLSVCNIGSGFVIVGADDRVKPILGYSFSGQFQKEKSPQGLLFLLDEYAREIEAITNSEAEASAAVFEQWKALEGSSTLNQKAGTPVVEPLVASTWNQGQYYNSQCPSDSRGPSGHAMVGCGAIVMGQVIRYWNYPHHGFGSESYYCNNSAYGYGDYGLLSVDFENATYEFSRMPDVLSSSTPSFQIGPVAKLLYHCGVAAHMAYGPSASTANSNNIISGLINHFGYQPTIQYIERNTYSNTQWVNKIKSELDAGAPIFYGGNGNYGGHVFICDGYTDDDYFHINWGFGGSYDGYFQLSALSPGPYDFSYNQAIITDIRPEQPPVGVQDVVGATLSVYPCPTTGKVTVKGCPEGHGELRLYDCQGRLVRTFVSGVGQERSIDMTGLPQGVYTLRLMGDGTAAVSIVKL